VPVTLVYREYDWPPLKERSETIGLLNPQNYVDLDNAGHFSFFELPKISPTLSNLERIFI
jgi:pimeloyl-ACP methyl ester carboxylesterase